MMKQVCLPDRNRKKRSKQSPCSASRLSRSGDTPSGALSHGQDPQETFRSASLMIRRALIARAPPWAMDIGS